ncbi:MAG: bifunctional metallophosphatase/5'-nucleotidase, partial [Barnesiella sp.]|nr:bifunctional metallophosphatase/5'-nucleotidase [Barnesiella sp.]
GQPYFQPYTIINRNGLRVAIIGLLTPVIPAWLPENLWKGLEFLPMEESARKWVEIVRSSEAPDVVIGLFHSGRDASKTTAGYKENESLTIARQVDGFDAVLMGHDHQLFCDYVTAPSGKSVAVINPANNANNLGTILLQKDASGKIILTPHNIDLTNTNPSEKYLDHFKNQFNEVKQFVEQPVSEITADISTRDAYFGPSAFMTLLHRLQHEVSGAQISMAAPLTFDGLIKKGQLTIADMFTLYKYENNLTTLKLTGKEIKDYLEYSYDLWLNRIENDADHLIRFASESPTISDNRLKNPSYNFDSASGINYTVDVTQGKGNRVQIISLADGSPFDPDSTYTVAINSYRAGGGGNHLTEGSGLSPQQLKGRIVKSTDKDLRYYLMQVLKKSPQINPEIDHNWKMIPEDIATRHAAIDRRLLFSPESSKNQK